MILRIVTFTAQGEALAHRMIEEWREVIPQYRKKEIPLEQWTGECFAKHLPILFVGACGIAVRAISPFVKDKLSDSAVLVMDEKGKYVIPLLSGHMGGANELAIQIAKKICATPVLTTATDVEGLFSVDVFAKNNGLRVMNREGIREVAGKLLRGETVTITWDDQVRCELKKEGQEELKQIEQEPVAETVTRLLPKGIRFVPFETKDVDIRIVTKKSLGQMEEKTQKLLLLAKEYLLGIGCKKDKSFSELDGFLKEHVAWKLEEEIHAIASIDLKAREEGLWELAQYYHLPFMTYSAEELASVEGEFSESEFVREKTGVANVCERAAMYAAGEGGELIQKKEASNGMTVAVSRRVPVIRFR